MRELPYNEKVPMKRHSNKQSTPGPVLRQDRSAADHRLAGINMTTKAEIARHTYHPAQPASAPTAAAQ
jgi:hypothetical protein